MPQVFSEEEVERRGSLLQQFKNCPMPEDELLANLGLFMSKVELARLLYLHELYRRIITVHGIVMEFGVRWGQNLALFETLRGIYEPFNSNRRIVGFDTFSGFPSVSEKDGRDAAVRKGGYSVTTGYETYLADLLAVHNREGQTPPVELVKGDASQTLQAYLSDRPHTMVALAYFDLDLYEPTRDCLELLRGHVTRGSVIAFDELNDSVFPGETLALKEVFGLDRYRLIHTPYSSARSYLVVD